MSKQGWDEAGPPGHDHDWRPYDDTDAYEFCDVWGCGAERPTDVAVVLSTDNNAATKETA